jgi:hypothetical protein
MKVTPTFCTLLLLVSCGGSVKTEYDDLHRVKFADLSFSLPGHFVETQLDTLINSWSKVNAPAEMIEMKIKQLEALRSRALSFAIFADTTDINNTVLVFNGPYLKISQWTSERLFLTLEERFRSEAKVLGVEFRPVENTYYQLSNGNDFLKVKFEWSSLYGKGYGTQYLVNINGFSYGFVVSNIEEEDFEYLIRSTKKYDKN